MAISLEEIRARVKTVQAGGQALLTVQDMVSAGKAMETPARPPCAFVATSSERAAGNRTQGVHAQRVSSTIAVVICLALERKAADLEDTVEAWRIALLASLAGWTPAGAYEALDYAGFTVLRMGEGVIWFELSFTTSWQLRQPVQPAVDVSQLARPILQTYGAADFTNLSSHAVVDGADLYFWRDDVATGAPELIVPTGSTLRISANLEAVDGLAMTARVDGGDWGYYRVTSEVPFYTEMVVGAAGKLLLATAGNNTGARFADLVVQRIGA